MLTPAEQVTRRRKPLQHNDLLTVPE